MPNYEIYKTSEKQAAFFELLTKFWVDRQTASEMKETEWAWKLNYLDNWTELNWDGQACRSPLGERLVCPVTWY